MKFGRINLFLALIALMFCLPVLYAQIIQSSAVSISKDKNLPFREAETIISEVKFRGLDDNYQDYDTSSGNFLSEDEFLRFLSENRVGISAGDKFNSRKIEKVIILLKKWLIDKSYWDAEITAIGEKLPKNRMNLIFSVKRNLTNYVSEIRFTGNKNVSGEDLFAVMNQCLGDSRNSFDRGRYNYCAELRVRGWLAGKGYFKAKIKQISPRFIDANLIVTIEVEEGVRYRIGKISIEGAKVFKRKEILEMWGQSEGDIADSKLLQDLLYEKLKTVYVNKGYVLYGAEFEPHFIEPQAEGLDGNVNISIIIDEGALFKLANIKFVGVDKEKYAELRDLFSLKDGEFYDQSKIEQGVRKINETRKFRFVDKDKDVEVVTDEESSEIYLVVKLKGTD